ncbi:MAG: ABC transporter permease, partial [Pseudomonadota bacterium]|nr:ABC transporter permease [Pseudomonadota bacterium]
MTTRSIDAIAAGALLSAPDAAQLAWAEARRKRLWRRRVLPALGITGLIAMWWAAVAIFDVKTFIAPSPGLVLQTLYTKRDVLLSNLIPTALEAAGGFVLGNLAAVIVATIFVHNKTLQDIFFPVVLMFNAIPIVAKAPILVLIMGNGMEPK